jgi:hypothetical protein
VTDFNSPASSLTPPLPKRAFVQDNEESINSRGQGCGGGEHWSLQCSLPAQVPVKIPRISDFHGPAPSQLIHTGANRKVG